MEVSHQIASTLDFVSDSRNVVINYFNHYHYRYPSKHLPEALETVDDILRCAAPVRYSVRFLRKFVWWLLGALATAALALFFVNEYAALGVAWDSERTIADVTGLGNVRLYGALRDAVQGFIETAPLLSKWEAKTPGMPIFLFGVLVAGLFFWLISWRWLKKYYDEVDATSLIIFPLSVYPALVMYGMPLFFVSYPHELSFVPLLAIVIGSAASIVCMLFRALKWLGRTIQCAFSRRDFDKARSLTAQFEDQAFRLHRYARLRILWAKDKSNGKYPTLLDEVEKKLQKADRFVRRYGVE